MTALALSLHLLAAAPNPSPLHLLDADTRAKIAATDELGPTPLRRMTLGQTPVTIQPVELAPHELGHELLLGFLAPLAVHGVAVVAEIPLLLVLVIAIIVDSNSAGTVFLGTLVALGIADTLAAPFAASYAIAHVHGDTSAGAIGMGFLGGLLGELVGLIPGGLLVAGLTSDSNPNSGLVLLALIGFVAIDAFFISGGASLLYHAIANPIVSAAPPPPAPSTGPASPTEPPPQYTPPVLAPPSPGSPPPVVGMKLSFAF